MNSAIIENRQSREDWSKILTTIVAVPGLATFPFVMFVILKKSNANMHTYKWIIANGVMSNFIFTLLMLLLRPVLLLPYLLMYYTGLNFLFDWRISEYLLAIIQFTFANNAMGLLLCLVHIYYIMTRSNSSGIFTKIWHIIILFATLYIYLFVLISMCIVCNIPRENIKDEFLKINPELDVFFKEHNLFTGVDIKNCPTANIVFPHAFSCGIIIFGLGFFFNFKLFKLIRQNNQYVTNETRQMQAILYRTYTVQSIVFCICFGTPCLLLNLSIMTNLIDHFIASLYTEVVLTSYLFLNNMIVLFVIKAYRTFILELLNKIFRFAGINVNFSPASSVISVISLTHT